MKKFRLAALFIALCSLLTFSSTAQSISLWTGSPYGNGAISTLVKGDTLLASAADSVFKVANTSAGYRDLGFQVLINKLSGTISGKMILWASMNGKDYVATDSATYAVTTPSSLITPAFTHSALISKTGSPYVWYAVVVTNTASGTAQVRVMYTARKQATLIQYN